MDGVNPSLLAATQSYVAFWQEAGFGVPCADEPCVWTGEAVDDATDFDAYVRRLDTAGEAKPTRVVEAAPTERPKVTVADYPTLPHSLAEMGAFYAALGEKTNRRCLAPQGTGAEPLLLVTDRPSAVDMKAGAYFAGEDGALLTNMLRAIGLTRADVFITAALPFAQVTDAPPPEVQAYLADLLKRQMSLCAARHILVMGDAGSRFLLGETAVKMRGRLHEINHDKGQLSLSTSFHPQGLLKRPEFKRMAWHDLQLVAKALGPL